MMVNRAMITSLSIDLQLDKQRVCDDLNVDTWAGLGNFVDYDLWIRKFGYQHIIPARKPGLDQSLTDLKAIQCPADEQRCDNIKAQICKLLFVKLLEITA